MPDRTAPVLLARRYRRLLFCYPRAYRKARGDEIVGTMLDAAPPGRDRPTAREAVNLVASGLRARLGRPDSRWVVAFSLVTAVIVGLFGSVVGYRLAWQAAARPLPTPAAVRQTVARIAPGPPVGGGTQSRDDYVFGWSGMHRSLPNEAVHVLVPPAIDDFDLDYTPGGIDIETYRRDNTGLADAARAARARLRADGWTLGTLDVSDDGFGEGPTATFSARRDGTVLTVSMDRVRYETLDGEKYWTPRANGPLLGAHVMFGREMPAVVPYGQGVAGVLAGAFGWLVFGWFSRRTTARTPGERARTRIAYGALVVSTLPAVVLLAEVTWYTVTTGTPDPPDPVYWGPSASPIDAIGNYRAVLDVIGAPALLALIVSALLRPRRAPAVDARRLPPDRTAGNA
ncbi:hypothetical protein [Actinocatenispora rupis]|uniref:Uncharacterized protein n=1 Tax=Actinocatenispora rupis TaxID=519421 RepID=A0A8J3J9Z2_9ACTN|nr:hypothetical protein [Actinocatenispora rupis]GID14582.1 hypothetical protein Aru02nite_54710 [Actinocatenispora rupis]